MRRKRCIRAVGAAEEAGAEGVEVEVEAEASAAWKGLKEKAELLQRRQCKGRPANPL